MVSFFGAACAGVATPLAVTTIAAVSANAVQRDLRISLIIFTSPFSFLSNNAHYEQG